MRPDCDGKVENVSFELDGLHARLETRSFLLLVICTSLVRVCEYFEKGCGLFSTGHLRL